MIRITEKHNCCGCSACAQCCPVGAITMAPDKQGFLYPLVDKNKCVECGKCERICPISNPTEELEFRQYAFLLQHKDKKILNESASGGAFTAIATQVINQNGVVFGAAYDQDFNVHHTYVENLDELKIFRNSKYVQSEIGESYHKVKQFLQCKRNVCFSGTPCQVEGLLNYLGEKPDNLLLIDIVCHAVPSPYVWKSYLKLIENRGVKDIIDLRFRDKDKYGYLYSQFKIQSKRRIVYQGIETNEMLRAFFSEICNRPSCYSCRFKKRYRRSDITLWDCFDIDEFTNSKEFRQDKGISRILVHTETGLSYINRGTDICVIEEITPDNALHFDAKEMLESIKINPKSNEFWNSFYQNPEKTLEVFFPIVMKNKFEATARRITMKIGVYQFIRKFYKSKFGNRQR